MASPKIAVDMQNLRLVLEAFNSKSPADLDALWYTLKDAGNPVHQLMLEYNSYIALVSVPVLPTTKVH